MLDAFESFDNGKIDYNHLHALSKASETIIAGLKTELQYAILCNKQPKIEFFGETNGAPLEVTNIKKLLL